VLVGGQRLYKTTWLNSLCPTSIPDYRFVGHIEPSTSSGETPNLMAEKWFINIDDQLEVIFGRDFNSMKSVITIPEITYRKPYMPMAERRKRISNFMASVNSTSFLVDTENRRYMCFEVEMCNIDSMPEMDEVWSEAYQLYTGGAQHWFEKEEYDMLNSINTDYSELTPEQEWLQICYRPATEEEISRNQAENLTASEIRKKLQEVSNDKTLNHVRLGRAFKRLDFTKVSVRIKDQGSRKVYPVVYINHNKNNNNGIPDWL